MAKYKPAGKTKKPARSAAAAIPCIVIVLGIGAIILVLFYFVLKSG
jgi:hypothetical protein